MPLAVAHFVSTTIVMRLSGLRLDKGKLTARELLLCAIIGLLPDIDMLAQGFSYFFGLNFWPHRMYTHSIFVPILLLLVGIFLYYSMENKQASTIFFFASIAIAVHIALDMFVGPLWLFFPISWQKIGLETCMIPSVKDLLIGIDAVLLVSWLGFRWKFYK